MSYLLYSIFEIGCSTVQVSMNENIHKTYYTYDACRKQKSKRTVQ